MIKNFIKKGLLAVSALVLLAGCNSSVSFSVFNAREFSVELKNAEAGHNTELGKIVVDKDKNITVNANLSSGAVDVTVYEIAFYNYNETTDEEEYDKGDIISVSHLEGQGGTIVYTDPGEYLIDVDVTEDASGKMTIKVQ